MAATEVIELSSDEDEPAPAPAPAAATSVITLSDTEDDPPPPQGLDKDQPVLIEDDEDDLAEQQRKRQRREAAACKICEAPRFTRAYKLAECGHSFCRACISGYVERKLRRLLASEVTCPTCAKQLTIADVQALSPPSAPSATPSGGGLGGLLPPGVPTHIAAMLGLPPAPPPSHRGGGGPSSSSSGALGARPVGSSVATRRLMKEFQSIRKAEPSSQGFDVELPDEDNLYTWDAHFFGFEKGTPLASDLSRVPGRRIDLRIAFPSNYPSAPPYVRVLRPRFMFRTGHVTIGGSICTEMLTSAGWSSTMTVESVLVGIRANMLVGGARLDLRNKHDYSEAEARDAFERMRREHGWY